MSIPADQNKSDVKQRGSFSSWVKTVIGMARRLIGFFNLTEEEQEAAGIFLDYDR
jgi:hypothetical protein